MIVATTSGLWKRPRRRQSFARMAAVWILVVHLRHMAVAMQDPSESATAQTCSATNDETCSDPSTVYGVEQRIVGTKEQRDEIKMRIIETGHYMNGVVNVEERFASVKNACRNQHALCTSWAATGECETNPGYMKTECAPACFSCETLKYAADETCTDVSTRHGVRQKYEGSEEDVEATRKRILETDKYLKETVQAEERFTKVRDHCKNQDELCSYWAVIGECTANPGFMNLNCGPACFSCDKLNFEERCPVPPNLKEAWGPGDLNKFFARVTTDDFYKQYSPTILCQPGDSNAHTGDCPWVVVLDSFLTEEECTALIGLGARQGYERSQDVGDAKFDGTFDGKLSDGRTSSNAWCQDECFQDPMAQQVLAKIENLTGIPDANSEHLQLLRYQVGQRYNIHHDYIEHDVPRAQGPRILTVFLYLNDVQQGGGTRFSDLNITVMPKRGKALLWPSVIDGNPTKREDRTHHEALRVEKGEKYAANAWIHLRDFKTPYANSCV